MREGTPPDAASPRQAHASVRWLRLLAWLSIVVPLLIFLIVVAIRYKSAQDDAVQRVDRALRVAHEHTVKVISASETLHERVLALVSGRRVSDLRASEAALHEALRARTIDQPQIQSILILDAQGRTLASSRLLPFPVVDMSDGEYFRAHRNGAPGPYLSRPIVTRTSGERVLNLSVPFSDEQGRFGGVINVAVLTSYFGGFFHDMVAGDPDLTLSLFTANGEVYTQWPAKAGGEGRLSDAGPIMQSIHQGHDTDRLSGVSSISDEDSYLAFRRVGGYPLFVAVGRDRAPMQQTLLAELALLFLVGALPVMALFATATIALRNARTALSTMEQLERETETRRRAEEALLQAQKLEALGRLTGGVAHDFNNALMVISNNLFLLRRMAPDVGSKQIESMTRAVKSATNLTRQLLAFSRRQPLVTEHIVLQERLPPLRDLIAPVLGSKVQLSVGVEPDTAPVQLDLAELELALLNLGINARDAMPSGGSLQIRARNAPAGSAGDDVQDMVMIEVRDTGSGIAPELLNKVFEPFFTTKAVGQGTGLGLSQVYGMCERMGGRARIASTVGLGTCVTLLFPRAAAQPVVAAAGPAPTLAALNKNVVLVEDNEEVAASVVPILESLGCRVTHVDRAVKARELLEQGARPDLIVSDVVMPGEMDGVALAQHIREMWPAQRLLLMTGYAEQLDHIKRMGFDVLPKPCTPHMLHGAIVRVCS